MDKQEAPGISPPKGQKRQPDDDLESEQRLAKRFNLLNLADINKLYHVHENPPNVRRTRSNAFSDSMQVDESRDRIFINSIDDELLDVESDEERLVFLPDIEKRLTTIPRSVLTGQNSTSAGNEVVLYGIPESISIPREQDNVRKAFLESRQRAREKQIQAVARQVHDDELKLSTSNGTYQPAEESDFMEDTRYDEDAMDLG